MATFNIAALWLGYGFIACSTLVGISAGLMLAAEIIIVNTKTKALIFAWYADRLKARTKEAK